MNYIKYYINNKKNYYINNTKIIIVNLHKNLLHSHLNNLNNL